MSAEIEGRRLANTFISERFNQADRVKMNRKTYRDDLIAAYLAGVGSTCSVVLKEHNKKPYEDANVLAGALEILAIDSMNIFYKRYSKGVNRLRKITLDDMINNRCEGLF